MKHPAGQLTNILTGDNMFDDLIEAVCEVVNGEEIEGGWSDKARAIYKAFDDAGSLQELEEFVNWFGENERGEFIPLT